MQLIIFHQGSPTSIEYFFAKSVQTEAKKQPRLHDFWRKCSTKAEFNSVSDVPEIQHAQQFWDMLPPVAWTLKELELRL